MHSFRIRYGSTFYYGVTGCLHFTTEGLVVTYLNIGDSAAFNFVNLVQRTDANIEVMSKFTHSSLFH